jgi:hypothetical protein
MGYPVTDKPCWNGTPAASRVSRAVDKWGWGVKKNMGTVEFEFIAAITKGFELLKVRQRLLLIIMGWLGVAIAVFYGLFRFN